MNARVRAQCVILVVAVAVSGCVTTGANRSASDSGANDYIQSCLTYGVLGAITGSVLDMIKQAGSTSKVRKTPNAKNNKVVTGFLAGCTIGFASTAVGRLFVEPALQRKAEEAAQRDAERRANEIERYARARAALESRPASTTAMRDRRDRDLESLREKFEKDYEAPRTESVGSTGKITFTGDAPDDLPDMKQPNSCLPPITTVGQSPSGTARQKVRYCRTPTGELVLKEVDKVDA